MWFIETKLVDFPEGPESLQMPEEIRQPVEENKANTVQGCKTKYRKWFVDKVCCAIHPNNYKPDNVESIEVNGGESRFYHQVSICRQLLYSAILNFQI